MIRPSRSILAAICMTIATAWVSTSTPAHADVVITSGDWVSACDVSGAKTVLCDRYGGFPTNTFPPSCEANNRFVCRNLSLCELATWVAVLSQTRPPVIDPRVGACAKAVGGRPVIKRLPPAD